MSQIPSKQRTRKLDADVSTLMDVIKGSIDSKFDICALKRSSEKRDER